MWLELTLVVSTSALLLYLWWTRRYDYWARLGLAHHRAIFPFGSLGQIFLMKQTMGERMSEIYRMFPEAPAVGYSGFRQPALLLRDPELVKTVLVKDFSRFHNNSFDLDIRVDPMFGINPFVTKDSKWKVVRAIHTPSLAVSKLKVMVPLMLQVCENMNKYISTQQGEPLEAKTISSFYTMDVVAACAFGFMVDSFSDPENGFRKFTTDGLFGSTWSPNLATLSAVFAPRVGPLLGVRIVSKSTEKFFVEMVREARTHRKNSEMRRNDLLQSLLDTNEAANGEAYTDLEMAGHCMTFFLDGNETSSLLLSFALYELAYHPEVQDRLRQEISTLQEFTYEGVHSLKYLDMVISETLRLHPPLQTLGKIATEDVTLESDGNKYPLEKGMQVMVPVLGLHTDPKHFPDPFVFDPGRFEDPSFHKFAYIPFGEGPRICLGFRFAQIMIKVGLARILKDFKIKPKNERENPIVQNPKVSILHTAVNGLWLYFEKLEKTA